LKRFLLYSGDLRSRCPHQSRYIATSRGLPRKVFFLTSCPHSSTRIHTHPQDSWKSVLVLVNVHRCPWPSIRAGVKVEVRHVKVPKEPPVLLGAIARERTARTGVSLYSGAGRRRWGKLEPSEARQAAPPASESASAPDVSLWASFSSFSPLCSCAPALLR
jgi:hypothetical protein